MSFGKSKVTINDFPSKVTIIIPTFNEEGAIGEVINKVYGHCSSFLEDIIVIDDGSTDATYQIASQTQAVVIQHKQNKGYGASLKTGIRQAKTHFILTMDADGQHRIEDVDRLLKFSDYDMVVGQRSSLIHSALWRMPGKWCIGKIANYLINQNIPDLNSGLRLIRREVAMKYMHLCPSGFSFSTTITMALLSRGYNVAYVPIQVEKRVGKSTVSLKTGFDTVILVLRLAALFNPLRLFIPVSSAVGLIGILWGIPYALGGRGVSIGSMLAIMTAILIFGLGILCDQISQLRLERFE